MASVAPTLVMVLLGSLVTLQLFSPAAGAPLSVDDFENKHAAQIASIISPVKYRTDAEYVAADLHTLWNEAGEAVQKLFKEDPEAPTDKHQQEILKSQIQQQVTNKHRDLSIKAKGQATQTNN